MATVPYADVAFGNAYFAERLGTEAWDAAGSNQDVSLKQSTRMIDLIPFVDEKTDEAQVRQFPRQDETEIPVEVQEATCEVALALLQGFDPTKAAATMGVDAEAVGDASVSYSAGGRGELARTDDYFGLPSPTAAQLLVPWVADPSEIDVVRM